MHEIEHDAFYDLAKRYDSDDEHHVVGEVDYRLLCDEKPYEGLISHRKAVQFVFDWLVKKSREDQEEARKLWGDDLADRLRPWVYDIDKARPAALDSQEFFYCPNTVKIDYYGNARYDAEWKPNDDNFGTTVPYWYALMQPVHGRSNKPEDFRKVNEALFPGSTDNLEISLARIRFFRNSIFTC